MNGAIRPPKEGEKYFPLVRVNEINGLAPEYIRDRVQFEFMTPLFPSEKFCLTGNGHNNMSTRIVDLFSPIGLSLIHIFAKAVAGWEDAVRRVLREKND